MQAAIKDQVQDFATAIEKRDLSSLEQLLHQDFRVLANQYPTVDKLTILSKESYLGLMKAEKIGGEHYEVSIQQITAKTHSATAVAKFKGKASTMYVTLLFVQQENAWKLIEDMAVME